MIQSFTHTDYGAACIMFLRGHTPKLLTRDDPTHWTEHTFTNPVRRPSMSYEEYAIRRILIPPRANYLTPDGLGAGIAREWELTLQPSGLYARQAAP